MATPSEIRAMSNMMTDLKKRVDLCQEIAKALMETGQAWWQEAGFNELLLRILGISDLRTDYGRARIQVMKTTTRALRNIQRMRRKALSADLIRAEPYIKELYECCDRCPSENRKRLERGGGFVCIIAETLEKESGTPFRFQLDVKGKIIERK